MFGSLIVLFVSCEIHVEKCLKPVRSTLERIQALSALLNYLLIIELIWKWKLYVKMWIIQKERKRIEVELSEIRFKPVKMNRAWMPKCYGRVNQQRWPSETPRMFFFGMITRIYRFSFPTRFIESRVRLYIEGYSSLHYLNFISFT